MKTILRALLVAVTLLAVTEKTTACVDFHPDSVVINILADTVNCNFILEISNLNMFGGNPNDFCSCGITNAIPDASTIEWVAFVDAETQEPIEGFDLWSYADAAGDSWEDADPGSIDWNGLVSGVNEAGIVAGQDVNLWIILDVDETDPEWSWLCSTDEGNLWEMFGQFSFGTDEWDNDAGELANSHQSITHFWDSYMYVLYITPEEYQVYINTLETFYNGIEEFQPEIQLSIFPNPTSDFLNITSNTNITALSLRNLLGQEVGVRAISRDQLDVSLLPEGIYLLELTMNGTLQTRKIKVAH